MTVLVTHFGNTDSQIVAIQVAPVMDMESYLLGEVSYYPTAGKLLQLHHEGALSPLRLSRHLNAGIEKHPRVGLLYLERIEVLPAIGGAMQITAAYQKKFYELLHNIAAQDARLNSTARELVTVFHERV